MAVLAVALRDRSGLAEGRLVLGNTNRNSADGNPGREGGHGKRHSGGS
jgi:hypothetical protein